MPAESDHVEVERGNEGNDCVILSREERKRRREVMKEEERKREECVMKKRKEEKKRGQAEKKTEEEKKKQQEDENLTEEREQEHHRKNLPTVESPKTQANMETHREKKAGCMAGWGEISCIDELKECQNILTVESRLQPKRSKRELATRYPVSGQLVADWVGPPECMPMLALQEMLRLGNNNPQLPELRRLHGLARGSGAAHEPFLTPYSKLHPSEVTSLANSLEVLAAKHLPANTSVEIPGDSHLEKQVNVHKAVFMVTQAVDSVLNSADFSKHSHGGGQLISRSWAILKSILQNSVARVDEPMAEN